MNHIERERSEDRKESLLEALQIIANMRPHKLAGKECKEIAKRALNGEPLEEYDEVITTSVGDGETEEVVSQTVIRYDRNPQNIRGLMKGIIRFCPQVYDHWDEVYALIKTYVHNEKHAVWFDVKHWHDSGDFFKEIIQGKLETHSPEGWQNFEKNLEWVKEYQRKDDSKEELKELISEMSEKIFENVHWTNTAFGRKYGRVFEEVLGENWVCPSNRPLKDVDDEK